MARFYADENFPLPVIEELRRLGHDVLTIYEDGKANQRYPDESVLATANELERAVLTTNLGVTCMNPRVKDVKPSPDYTLTLTFQNGEVKIFDVKPYLDKGIFKELQEKSLFNSVKPFLGSIQWRNGQDLCPDTLYMAGKSQLSPCQHPPAL